MKAWPRRAVAVTVVAGFAGLVALLAVAARAVAADSDGASLVLAGQSLVHGNVLLHGWIVSLDSFWSSDVLLYALGVLVSGVSPALLTFVPALLYAFVVSLGVAAAAISLPRRSAWAGGAVALVLLAFPTWALTLTVLRGAQHMGTVALCLAAFVALHHRRRAVAVGLTAALLCAGTLGDLLTIAYGVVPILCAGGLAALRARRARAAIVPVAASAAAVAAFVVIHAAIPALGGFSARRANPLAHGQQMLDNIRHLYSLGGELIGLHTAVFGTDTTPAWLQDAHVVVAVVVIGCALAAGVALLAGVIRPTRPTLADRSMDDLLVFAALGSACSYVLLAFFNATPFARYLAPAAIFMCVLAGRMLGRGWALVHGRVAGRALPALAGVVAILVVAGFAYRTSLPATTQPGTRLASWLEQHGLHEGVGAYWSASMVTVVSHDLVRVRPVVPDRAGRLVRYDWESDAAWYRRQRFDFLVFQPGSAAAGIDAANATHTWGRPGRVVFVDGYEVIIWDHPFGVPAGAG